MKWANDWPHFDVLCHFVVLCYFFHMYKNPLSHTKHFTVLQDILDFSLSVTNYTYHGKYVYTE